MHLSPLLLFIQRDTVLLFELVEMDRESISVARTCTIARVRQHDLRCDAVTGDRQTYVRVESSESVEGRPHAQAGRAAEGRKERGAEQRK